MQTGQTDSVHLNVIHRIYADGQPSLLLAIER